MTETHQASFDKNNGSKLELDPSDFDLIIKALEAYTHNTQYLELYQKMIMMRLLQAHASDS